MQLKQIPYAQIAYKQIDCMHEQANNRYVLLADNCGYSVDSNQQQNKND